MADNILDNVQQQEGGGNDPLGILAPSKSNQGGDPLGILKTAPTKAPSALEGGVGVPPMFSETLGKGAGYKEPKERKIKEAPIKKIGGIEVTTPTAEPFLIKEETPIAQIVTEEKKKESQDLAQKSVDRGIAAEKEIGDIFQANQDKFDNAINGIAGKISQELIMPQYYGQLAPSEIPEALKGVSPEIVKQNVMKNPSLLNMAVRDVASQVSPDDSKKLIIASSKYQAGIINQNLNNIVNDPNSTKEMRNAALETIKTVNENVDKVERGELQFDIATGTAYKNVSGFLSGISNAFTESMRHSAQSDLYDRLNDDQKKQQLQIDAVKGMAEVPVQYTGVTTKAGEMAGSSIAPLVKYMAAEAIPGAFIPGAGWVKVLVGATAGILATINDVKKESYTGALKKFYIQNLNDGMNPDDAFSKADKDAKGESNIAMGVHAVTMMGFAGAGMLGRGAKMRAAEAESNLLKSMTPKDQAMYRAFSRDKILINGVWLPKSAVNYTRGIIQKTLQVGKDLLPEVGIGVASSLAGSAVTHLYEKAKGYEGLTKDEVIANAVSMAAFPIMMRGLTMSLTGATKLPLNMLNSFRDGVARYPNEFIYKELESLKSEGIINEQQAQDVFRSIEDIRAAMKAMPEGKDHLTPSIVGMMKERNKLKEKLKTADESFKPELNKKINEINDAILQLSKIEKPKEAESDVNLGERAVAGEDMPEPKVGETVEYTDPVSGETKSGEVKEINDEGDVVYVGDENKPVPVTEIKMPEIKVEAVSDIEAKKADIEKRRQEELDSVDISKGGKLPIEGYEEFYKKVNEKYDAELAALEQASTTETPKAVTEEQPKQITPEGKRLFSEPVEDIKNVSGSYKQSKGIETPEGERIFQLDEENSKKIADAYDEMKHDPNNPEVKAAYEAMANETLDQHKSLIDAGYKVEIYEGEGEPYKNSQEMLKDLRDNKHLFVLSTEKEFGQVKITDQQRAENPLLRDSGFKDINGKPLLINDAFRFVHDAFGHGERGNSFGPKGEENAWDVHARMYSPLARRAMTTETRGQNSWVNFGKHLRDESGNVKKVSAKEKPFAEQKMGLMPEWTSQLMGEEPVPTTEKKVEGISNVIVNRLKKTIGKIFGGVKVLSPEEFKATLEEVRKNGGVLAHAWGGFEKKGFEETPEWKQLVESGAVELNFDVSKLAGKPVVIINPDNMITGGIITKDGKPIIDGNGGINFVTKFGDVWASSNSETANQLVKYINEVRERDIANGGDGTVHILVSKGDLSKSLTSHDGAKAAMNVLEHFVDKKHISLKDFRNALVFVGKKYGIEFSSKADAKTIHSEIQKKFFGVEDSSFKDRGYFVNDIIKFLGENSESAKENIKKIREELNTEALKFVTERKTGRIKFAPEGIIDAIGLLLSDNITKNARNSEIYAVIEVKHDVSVVNLKKEEGGHPSYPFHIVQKDASGNKVNPRLLIVDKPRHVTEIANNQNNDPVPRTIRTGRLNEKGEEITESGAGKLGSNQIGMAKGFVKPSNEINQVRFLYKKKSNFLTGTYYEPHLTETKDGKNLVFFHVSRADERSIRKGIDSRKYYSIKTGREEKGLQYGVASYYTKATDGERMVGGEKYAVVVPKDKVYPMDTDPNGYRAKAEKKIPQNAPFREEAIKRAMADLAKKDGFQMAVGEWYYDRMTGESDGMPALRADALVPLKPEKEMGKYKTNEGKQIFHPEKKMIEQADKLNGLLTQATMLTKDYGDVYRLAEKYRIEGGIPTEAEFNQILDWMPKKLRSQAEAIKSDIYYKAEEGGEIYGFVHNGVAYFNNEVLTPNTIIHEAGHIWTDHIENNNPELFAAGMKKVKGSEYLKDVMANQFYIDEANKLPESERMPYFMKEALAKAIGDNGEKFVTESERASFKQWVMKMWRSVIEYFGLSGKTPEEVANMTIDEFAKSAAAELFQYGEGMGKMPKEEAATTVTEEMPAEGEKTKRTVGISQRELNKMAERLGLPPIEKGKGTTPEQMAEVGRKLIADGVDPVEIGNQFKEDGLIDGNRISIVRAHLENLENKRNEIGDRLTKEGIDPKANEEYLAAEKELQDWATQVVKPMGSKWGEAGQAMQGSRDMDTDSFTSVRERAKEINGKDLEGYQIKKIQELTDQNKTLAEKVAEFEKKFIEITNEHFSKKKGEKGAQKGKFETKAKVIAKKIVETELPKWLQTDDPTLKKSGFVDLNDAKKLLAEAIIQMGRLIDQGVEVSDAIKQAVSGMVEKLGEGRRGEIEKDFETYYNNIKGLSAEERRIEQLKKKRDKLMSGEATQKGVAPEYKFTEEQKAEVDALTEEIDRLQTELGLKKSKMKEPLTEEELKAEKDAETERLRAKFANKTNNKFTYEEGREVWEYMRDNYLNKGVSYPDALTQTSSDLGLSHNQIAFAITTPQNKVISNQFWKTQRDRINNVNATKKYVEGITENPALKKLREISGKVRGVAVFGHGGIFVGTHAGTTLFMPTQWSKVIPAFFNGWKFAYGEPAAYEMAIRDIKRRPNYILAQRSGLKNDVDVTHGEELQASQQYLKGMGKWLKKLGGAGEKGFNAIKLLRQDLFDRFYDNLTPEQKADPKSAENVSYMVNLMTGATNIKVPEWANETFFAFGMEASRWQRLTTAPLQAGQKAVQMLYKYARGKSKEIPPSDMVYLKTYARVVGEQLATFASFLAINAALQNYLNPKNPVNVTDPEKRDYLKFKFGDLTIDPTSGLLGAAKFLEGLAAVPFSEAKDRRGRKVLDEIGSKTINYGRGKLAPFYGIVADAVQGEDFNRNVLPWRETEPSPGKRKIGYLEYTAQKMPLPFAHLTEEMIEAAHENTPEYSTLRKVLFGAAAAIISGGTGTRTGVQREVLPDKEEGAPSRSIIHNGEKVYLPESDYKELINSYNSILKNKISKLEKDPKFKTEKSKGLKDKAIKQAQSSARAESIQKLKNSNPEMFPKMGAKEEKAIKELKKKESYYKKLLKSKK